MKKSTEIKYPNSANLFLFCRRVLDHKFGGIRVIDQDVGQILGFDPADCSHWKKGKKNIRSIQAMKSIAQHLGVDEKLVIDVASGDLDDLEAFCEYSGYGAFHLDNRIFDAAKKEFFKRHAGSWSKDKENTFRSQYSPNEAAIDGIVAEIHSRINFQEAPLYLPEVLSSYPELSFAPLVSSKDSSDTGLPQVTVVRKGSQTQVAFPAGTEMRPYMRYRIAKGMAEHFLADIFANANADLAEYATHLIEVQSNLFAAKLLVPIPILRRELSQINVSRDIVGQLSETFWVSKHFMNRRLKEALQDSGTL